MMFIKPEPYLRDSNWRSFRFPYRVGIPCEKGGLRFWRGGSLPLHGDLPAEGDIFGVNFKLKCLGEMVRSPIDRIDVAETHSDVIDVQLASGYDNVDTKVWQEFIEQLSASFCLPVKVL